MVSAALGPPTAIWRPSGEKAIVVISPGSRPNSCTSFPEVPCQIRMAPSPPTEANASPFRGKATDTTDDVCPTKVVTRLAWPTSQILIRPSLPPETHHTPSGERARDLTPPV